MAIPDGDLASPSHQNVEDNPDTYPEGGWRAWGVVLGSWCGLFPAFGLMNTMGVFEDWLTTHQLRGHSRSSVAWIFSVYVFLLFFGSVQAGPLFDLYGLNCVLIPGSIGLVASVMILSIASDLEYYQFMLGFGVLGGISASLLVTPSMACINHWFFKRRAFATGIGVTAGGLGGVIFPIMIKDLSKSIGFAWATRVLGFICLVLCALGILLQKTRLPPNKKGLKTIDVFALRDPSFALTAIAMVLTDSSGAIPMIYLTSYARANQMGLALSYQLMSILNAGSILGRLAPGYAADKWGRFNVMIVTTALSTVLTLTLWMLSGQNQAAIVSYAALFGVSSGSAISLTPVCVAQISQTEDFGKRFGTTYTMVGLGVLVAIPIAGATLKGDESRVDQGGADTPLSSALTDANRLIFVPPRVGYSIHVGSERPSLEERTCRRRKVKCGEERPVCERCFHLRLNCEWGVPVKRGKSVRTVRHIQPRWSFDSPSATAITVPAAAAASPSAIFPPSYATPNANANPPTVADLTPISADTISSPVAWPSFPPYSQLSPSPLYPSLSTTDIPCANSLVLTDHDRKYFQFFPSSSIVFYYMKPWEWSSFGYLYQGPAASNKVIMRMLLALSASDMHRQGLVVRSPGRPTAEDHARYHYGLAVKEFRQLLESPKRVVSTSELEMIFATMFLMVTYEWQYGHCVHHLQLHLQGVRSLLETHPELFQIKDVNNVLLSMDSEQSDESIPRVSFIPEQLLLWILYIDASCRPMGITESLYDYVLQSGNAALHPDRLHRCARLWSRCFWGKQYPDQQVSDDMENYRALELLHVGMTLRYRTLKLLSEDSHTDYEVDVFFNEIMSIHDVSCAAAVPHKFHNPPKN
ncbi:hypothetical protein FE257_002528 [Aspergillus nanangensis]|uniref:Zn(2)-C6 fungal-type domain-containing protein n=1 Tax=Aspergillus nanangensis TaxID=2582783 RepID=A0AAD4GWP5_ASPNN|nr:hypothetical protein FE257_002528 [Aspergillus nanangensis]